MRALVWALSLAAVALAVQIWWSPYVKIHYWDEVDDICKVGNTVVAVGHVYALIDAERGRLVKNETKGVRYTHCVAVGDTVYAIGIRGDPSQPREVKLYAIKNVTVVKAVDLAAPAGGLATDGRYLYLALNGKRVRMEKRTLDLELVKYVELDSGVVHDVIVHPTTGDIWLSGSIGGPTIVILDKSLEVKKITKIPNTTVIATEFGSTYKERVTPTPYYMCVDREGYVYAGADAGFITRRKGFLLKFDHGGRLLSMFNLTTAAQRVEQEIRSTHKPIIACVGDYFYVLTFDSGGGRSVALYVMSRNFDILHRFRLHIEGRPSSRLFYDGKYLYTSVSGILFVIDPSPGDVFYYSPAVGGVYGRGYAVVGNRTVPVEFTPERVYFRGGVPYGAPHVAVYVTHFRLGDVEVGLKGPPYKVYEGPAWPLWTRLDLAAGGATARVDVSHVSKDLSIAYIGIIPYELQFGSPRCCDAVIYWGDKAVARGSEAFSVYLPRTDLIGGRYVAKAYYRGMYIDEKEFDLVRDTKVEFEGPRFGILVLQVVGPDNKTVDAKVTVIRLSDNAQFTTKPGGIWLPPGKYLVRAEAQGRRAEAEVEIKPYTGTELTLTIPVLRVNPTPATTPTPTVATPTPTAPRPAAPTAPPPTPRPAQPPSAQSASSGALEQVLALLIIVAIVAASLVYVKKKLSR